MPTRVHANVQISGLGIAGGIQTEQAGSPPRDPVTMPGEPLFMYPVSWYVVVPE